jgi:hypothetical protein
VPPDFSVGEIAEKWVSLQLEFLAIPNRGLTAHRPFIGGARGFWLVEGPPAARDKFKEVASRAGELLTTKPEWLRAHKVTFSEFLARGGLQMWVLFLGSEKTFTTTLDNLPQRSAEACVKCATEAQSTESS